LRFRPWLLAPIFPDTRRKSSADRWQTDRSLRGARPAAKKDGTRRCRQEETQRMRLHGILARGAARPQPALR